MIPTVLNGFQLPELEISICWTLQIPVVLSGADSSRVVWLVFPGIARTFKNTVGAVRRIDSLIIRGSTLFPEKAAFSWTLGS